MVVPPLGPTHWTVGAAAAAPDGAEWCAMIGEVPY